MTQQSTNTRFEKVQALEMQEGDGARVKRLFPTQNKRNSDPFVLMDEFFVEPPAGFPRHPHRGFEGITYMLEGGFQHKDNMGNDTAVDAGGIQCFTAGKGMEHSEMPVQKGVNHGIQLWVNLPKAKKNVPPAYQQIDPEDVPEQAEDFGTVRTIAGKGAPLQLHTGVCYQHVILQPNKTWTIPLTQTWNGYIYLLSGGLHIEKEQLKSGEALFFSEEEELTCRADEKSSLILLAGKPHHEPIRHWGPFVD